MKKNLLIIIPVYNEQSNIKPIVLKIFKEIKRKVNILFIDDNSQDKTRSQIYLSKKKYKEIYLIKRGSKLGIGSAHKYGLRWGYLKKYKTKVTFLVLCCFGNCLAINDYSKQSIEKGYATHEKNLCQT